MRVSSAILGDSRVILLLLVVFLSLLSIERHGLEYGMDLVGGTSVILKVEGTCAKIKTNMDEGELKDLLEKETGVFVNVYKREDHLIPIEIMKLVDKEELESILKGKGEIVEFKKGAVFPITSDQIISTLQQRANWIGVKDIAIKPLKEKEYTLFISIEIAGREFQEARDVLTKTGKFEAKVVGRNVDGTEVNSLVFTGKDIQRVEAVQLIPPEYKEWRVPLTISEEGARRFAEATKNMALLQTDPKYLDGYLEIYVDDELKDRLRISADLKGRTQREVVVEGTAQDREGAYRNGRNMQVLLRSGALPVKVSLAREEYISPRLGEGFKKKAGIAGLVALAAIALVVFFFYRKTWISLPVISTLLSEVIIILGFASMIRWELDLPSIAGIVAAVGTGVDQQIIITDEVLREKRIPRGVSALVSRAFFVILGAALTTVAAMSPLLVLGFGRLKGFALTTIVGVLAGVLVTRPAYGRIITIVVENKMKKGEL
ncbi:hypothetical protein DRN52_02675 [Thermococci archaeon]|nr:MAG: hypothetical protein DRN52_02675 [Thermococci archaeon]